MMKEKHPALEQLEEHKLGDEDAPYIVAETACSHDGDPDTLRALVRRISEEEPDAIQIEIFSPDHQVTPDHEIYDGIQDLALSWETWEEIIGEMKNLEPGILIFAYDRPSLEFALEHDINGVKLSSADLTNPEMIELAAESEVPTNLSTGGCSVDEISRTLDQYMNIADTGPILMHGVQNFPTETENAWINRIQLLKGLFGLPIGYQDHTDGEKDASQFIDLLALGVGASVLEKHVTLSRSETETDFEAALEPDEFGDFTDTVRMAGKALGSRRIRSFSASEREYQEFQKKKIVTTEEIKAGERITRNRVEFLRNNSTRGMSPRKFSEIEDSPVTTDLPAFHTLEMSDIDLE
jgi:N,N'-diacetyllegionaminate synthase